MTSSDFSRVNELQLSLVVTKTQRERVVFQQLYRREEAHEVNKEAEGNRQELQQGDVCKVLTVRKTI